MKRCAICGHDLADDLFASVTDEPCCAICKTKYIGGLPTSPELIARAREMLRLKDGEYLEQDRLKEARKILGRRR